MAVLSAGRLVDWSRFSFLRLIARWQSADEAGEATSRRHGAVTVAASVGPLLRLCSCGNVVDLTLDWHLGLFQRHKHVL